MKITVTDGYTLNPGDLSWEQIRKFGTLSVHDRTESSKLIDTCIDSEIILTNKVAFTRETVFRLPKLKLISVLATGYNVIDVNAAREREIAVCNVPAYGTASVAQHVFALLLELTNHVGLNSKAVAEGKWQNSLDFCFTEKPVMEIAGKVLGIVGMGHIGEQVACIGRAFGLKVIYHNRSRKNNTLAEYRSLNELFEESDFISLHCPLSADNKEFVKSSLLSKMKASAYLINTARGQLINEQDLAKALNEGIIAGAALDVLSAEPPDESNPLLKAKNCVLTPHTAWISKEARQRIMQVTFENIKAFLADNPINQVN